VSEPYHLLIDSGNTFIKSGRYRPQGTDAHEAMIESGHTLHNETPSLRNLYRRWPRPDRIVISNVAGTKARGAILRTLEAWPNPPQPYWLTSLPEQCGVTNGYRNPAQLGTDRWAALIGARHLYPDRAVLVATCGTATTLDLLAANGKFLGGCIMPGLGLMIRSLHEGTAGLPDADGEYADHPDHTVDAIVSGCQHAQAGAVERLFHRNAPHHQGLMCIISGGAARAMAPRLAIPFTQVDNLVIEGLYQISKSLSP
jgi:type III pantothenate kinase